MEQSYEKDAVRESEEVTATGDSGGKPARQGQNKKVRRTQEERTALSDKRMFDAAMELICEQGAYRTTLKEVCEKAGYSRGLANYRFGSKDAFFDQLIGHFNRAWKEQLEKTV